jgi:hypothetical protein
MLRKRGLTRGAGPEHNIIQNPHLSRAIQQSTGTRQAHVAPVMGDSVQPVIIADDIRTNPVTNRPATYGIQRTSLGDGIQPTTQNMLYNPANSGVVVQLLQVSVYGTIAGDLAFAMSDSVTLGLGASPAVRGARLCAGNPTIGRTDLPPSGFLSQVGSTTRASGVVSPYFWLKPQSAFAGGLAEDEVLFFANGENIILLPTGVFVVEAVDTNASIIANFLWNEFPL